MNFSYLFDAKFPFIIFIGIAISDIRHSNIEKNFFRAGGAGYVDVTGLAMKLVKSYLMEKWNELLDVNLYGH